MNPTYIEMYLVVYTKIRRDDHKDHDSMDKPYWTCFETFEEAEEKYKSLLDSPLTNTASICGIIDSTDYDPTYLAHLLRDPT